MRRAHVRLLLLCAVIAASVEPAPTPGAPASAGTVDAGGRLSFERERDALTDACDPKKHPASEVSLGYDPEHEPGAQFMGRWVASCMNDEVVRTLTDARAHIGVTEPARAAGLEKEQADFFRYAKAISSLSEQHWWVDLDHGLRRWGWLHGMPFWSAEFHAQYERMFYARALATGDAAALAARVRALSVEGEAARRELAQLRAQAEARLPTALEDEDGGAYPAPVVRADLDKIVASVAEADVLAPVLSRSTCAWEALARALGGAEPCAQALDLYYYAHWTEKPLSDE